MKLVCPKCGAEWYARAPGTNRPTEGGGIVEATCECFECDTPNYLYNRFMRERGLENATTLMYRAVETPFGNFKIGSLHPFGVSVSETGFGELLAFSWIHTGDWKLIDEDAAPAA